MSRTQALFLDDSYARTCEAQIIDIKDNRYLVLDKTVCYAQGGGQPGDTGSLMHDNTMHRIQNTIKQEGEILHDLGTVSGLRVGDKVIVEIDWERRYTLMRYHTAAHVLCSVFHSQAGALITGNQITEERLRIDFSLDDYDPVRIQHYVAEANRLLALDATITARSMLREEALALPGMVKLAGALPPSIPELRILTIRTPEVLIDEQADGGTHVHSTKEVGTIEFVSSENKGKANRRVYVKLL